MKMLFTYSKGKIVFDDYVDTSDEFGTCWSQIYPRCIKRYKSALNGRLSDGGSGYAICGVEGCCNTAETYVDFKRNEVKFCNANVI